MAAFGDKFRPSPPSTPSDDCSEFIDAGVPSTFFNIGVYEPRVAAAPARASSFRKMVTRPYMTLLARRLRATNDALVVATFMPLRGRVAILYDGVHALHEVLPRDSMTTTASIDREPCRFNPAERAAPDRRDTGGGAAAFLAMVDYHLLGRAARGGRQTDSKYATMHPCKLLRCVDNCAAERLRCTGQQR